MLALAALIASMNLPVEPKPYTVEFHVVRLPPGNTGVWKLFEGQPTRVLPSKGETANTALLIEPGMGFSNGRVEMRGPQVRTGRKPITTEVTDAAWLVWPGWLEEPSGRDYSWDRRWRAYIARTPCTFTASAIAAGNGRIELTIGYAAVDLLTPEGRRPLPAMLDPFYSTDVPPPRSFVPDFHQQLQLSDTSRRRVVGQGTLKVGETLAMYAGRYATWPASDELLVPYRHQFGFYNHVQDDVIVFATVRQ